MLNTVNPLGVMQKFTLAQYPNFEFYRVMDTTGAMGIINSSFEKLDLHSNGDSLFFQNKHIDNLSNAVFVTFTPMVIDGNTGSQINDDWGLMQAMASVMNSGHSQGMNMSMGNSGGFNNALSNASASSTVSNNDDVYGTPTVNEPAQETPVMQHAQQTEIVYEPKNNFRKFLPGSLEEIYVDGRWKVVRAEDYLDVYTSNGINGADLIAKKLHTVVDLMKSDKCIVSDTTMSVLEVANQKFKIADKDALFGFGNIHILEALTIDTITSKLESTDNTTFLNNIFKSDFSSTASSLDNVIVQARNGGNNHTLGSLLKIDKRLTREVNNILGSVKKGVSIDSFALHGSDLVTTIEGLDDMELQSNLKLVLGKFNTFLNDNAIQFNNYVTNNNKEVASVIEKHNKAYLDNNERTNITPSFVKRSYKLCTVFDTAINNILSNPEMLNGELAIVTRINTPDLYLVMEYIYKEHNFYGDWILVNGFSKEVFKAERDNKENFTLRAIDVKDV